MAKYVEMPSISFIVARSYPGCVIGCDNKLPWHLRSDLRRFREITTGHVVIMGSKTFASIGRPLPNRANVVLSNEVRSNDGPIVADGPLFWASNREAALYLADLVSIANEKIDFFVIGGERIYSLFLDADLINKVYLTEVFADVAGDAYFRYKFARDKWRLLHEEDLSASEHDDYGSRFLIYERKERRNRLRWLSEFYTDKLSKTEWVSQYLKEHRREINSYEQAHQLELFESQDSLSLQSKIS
ncbi:MAG: dihydrofolate reductase [Methylovirgula sp.]|nr:dihydrofolate reductase [Methylovirgula sp.]